MARFLPTAMFIIATIVSIVVWCTTAYDDDPAVHTLSVTLTVFCGLMALLSFTTTERR